MDVSAFSRFCLGTERLECDLMQESDGVIVKEHVGPSGDGGMGDCITKVAQVSCTYGQSVVVYLLEEEHNAKRSEGVSGQRCQTKNMS